MKKMKHDLIILGGMPFELYGRAAGPYRVRTICERAGFSAFVMDTPWVLSQDQLMLALQGLVGKETLAIGLSCTWENKGSMFGLNEQHWMTHDLIHAIRHYYPWVKIVAGVSNTSRLPRWLLERVDWVVGGFSESSLPRLLNHLKDSKSELEYSVKHEGHNTYKFVNGNSDYILQDMNELETIYKASDAFLSHQPLPIELCRGCVFHCAYCTYPFLGKKNTDYLRGVESIASELRRNYKLFGTHRYMIADDTFNDSMEKIERLQRAVDEVGIRDFQFVSYIRAELLIIRPEMIPALVKLGLRGAFCGIESFSNHARKAVGRSTDIAKVMEAIQQLRSHGVRVFGSFIYGLPGDSRETLLQWERVLRTDVLDGWSVGPLMISAANIESQIDTSRSIQSKESRSLIEQNLEKYGYTALGIEDNLVDWINKDTDFRNAIRECERFNERNPSPTNAGWDLGAEWYHGSPSGWKESGYKLGRERAVRLLTENNMSP